MVHRDDKAAEASAFDLSRLFGDLVRTPIEAIVTLVDAREDGGDSARLWRFWASLGLASIENKVRASFEDLVGFDLAREVAYAQGDAHPELKAPGASMLDAFSGFEAILRAQHGNLRLEEHPFSQNSERNVVTFGSPSSNILARQALGYNRLTPDEYTLTSASNFGIKPPIKYDLSSNRLEVNRLRFKEPHWALVTPEGTLTPQLLSNGVLEDDYLVLTSTPNTESARTARTLSARIGLRQNPALSAGERQALEKDARGPVDRLLVVGGLHGPGTAAAKMLMQDLKAMKRLSEAIREINAEGGFWQAVVRASVAVDKTTQRDAPIALHEIRAYPIESP